MTDQIFTATSGKDAFTVDYSDNPPVALHFAGPDTIYEHAKGALLKETFGKQTSYTDATVSGTKGKRLVFAAGWSCPDEVDRELIATGRHTLAVGEQETQVPRLDLLEERPSGPFW